MTIVNVARESRPSAFRRDGTALNGADAAVLLALVAVHAVVLWVGNAFTSAPPAEDAAILLRYSEHLANGQGIVWNVGEDPVDGATDVLFMALIALLRTLGVGLVAAARALDVAGTVGVIVIAYVTGRAVIGQPRWISSIGPLLVAVGPAAIYTRLAFGAPFFGFAVALAALCALLVFRQPTFRRALAFGVSSLFMGLVRPEGVILAALLAAGTLVAIRGRRGTLVAGVAVGLVVPGLVYFAARWSYFGFPLPNPYYKKGSGELHPQGLKVSLLAVARWLFPLAVLYVLPLTRSRDHWRQVFFLALPVTGFTAVWLLLSNEMNILNRFQYPVLVLLAMSLPWLWVMTVAAWRPTMAPRLRRWLPAGLAAAACLNLALVGAFALDKVSAGPAEPDELRGRVGTALKPFRGAGHLLAVTEAGLVPLNSGWRTLDLWGLNDEQIAHNGLDAKRLVRADPAIVLMHEYPRPDVRTSSLDGWNDMVDTVRAYMGERGEYERVATWGEPLDPFVVYVSRQTPARERIRAAVCRAVAADPSAVCRGRRSHSAARPRPNR